MELAQTIGSMQIIEVALDFFSSKPIKKVNAGTSIIPSS